MIRVEKPDFVVVTGDISYPVPFQAGTFNNKSGAKIFAELMETLGVYWTLAYGNHDTEAYSYYTREQLTDFTAASNTSTACCSPVRKMWTAWATRSSTLLTVTV